MNASYNINIRGLFGKLKLGRLLVEPQALSGGHLNRMFSVSAESGKYAVKAINPQVMLRPEAMGNYINSENVAQIASSNLPALAAKRCNGTAVQEYDGQYYLIYNFIYGKCLTYDSLIPEHCAVMGGLLAKLHNTDFSSLGLRDDYSSVEKAVDWDYYLEKGRETGAVWTNLIAESLKKLYEWNGRLIEASSRLAENTVISHGDLEPKNVIWKDGGFPIIIDWESAGFVHPAYDMLETAVYWAKENDGSISENKFKTFISAYLSVSQLPEVEWSVVADKGFVMLGWLEYSLRRSLRIECADDEEQRMGTEHVFGTIANLKRYESEIPRLINWIKEVKDKNG